MDTAFFILAKLVGAVLRVETWLFLLVIVSFWASARNRMTLSRITAGAVAAAILGVGGVPLADLMQRRLESTYPAAPELGAVDGIILLGGAEDVAATVASGSPQVGEAGDRYLAALALAHRYPLSRILFSGGSGRVRDLGGAAVSEADIAERIFLTHGISPDRIMLEGGSRNTAENARLAIDLAQPKDGERWVLVTSAFHMPRAMQSFAAAGWTGLVPYPVDHRARSWSDGWGWNFDRNLILLNTAIREWVGRIAYAATGR